MMIQNNKGARTSPCLTPFRISVGLEVPRSHLIEALEP